jgi:hypothetical protein
VPRLVLEAGLVRALHEAREALEAEAAPRGSEVRVMEAALERVPRMDRDPGHAQGGQPAEGRSAGIARKAGLTREDVINTLPLEKLFLELQLKRMQNINNCWISVKKETLKNY